MTQTALVIIMGPAGSGKTTLARALAAQTGWPMIEADAYHTDANKQKMASGQALTDADRASWITALCKASQAQSEPVILLACSALTPYVQDRLRTEAGRSVRWVLLDVPAKILEQRLRARTGHFMPVSQLADQLNALSPPSDAIRIEADKPVGTLAELALTALGDIEGTGR